MLLLCLKKFLVVVIMMFACLVGSIGPSTGHEGYVINKVEAMSSYAIQKYWNGDRNWPCIWPGGNMGLYMDLSSVTTKDGWQYFIEGSVDNDSGNMFRTRVIGVKRSGNKICTNLDSQEWPIDMNIAEVNAWKIINGYAH